MAELVAVLGGTRMGSGVPFRDYQAQLYVLCLHMVHGTFSFAPHPGTPSKDMSWRCTFMDPLLRTTLNGLFCAGMFGGHSKSVRAVSSLVTVRSCVLLVPTYMGNGAAEVVIPTKKLGSFVLFSFF